MRRLGKHIRQNVVAYIALFFALGSGSAYASHLIVRSSDIVNNEVRSEDVRNDDLSGGGLGSRDVRPNALTSSDVSALTGADVNDNSLTGNDVNESTFGQVPSAANAGNAGTLDGKDSTELGVRAYAVVDGATCPENFCNLDRNKNVAYAFRVSEGRYCVRVNGIDASSPNSLAILGNAALNRDATLVWVKGNSACVASEFEVETTVHSVFLARTAAGGTQEATVPSSPFNVRFVIAVP